MAQAPRDQNSVPTLLGASSSDGITPIPIYADPVTHRLLVDLPGSGGTVTSVSVVTANGFAGSVANATTTPAITLSTTVTGIVKGNGTALSAAVANTDYQSPVTLTTTGTSGAATFNGTTLNIPVYSSGAAATITVANEATDTTCFPVFVTAATGDLGPKSNTSLIFNSNTGALGASAIIPSGSTVPTNGLYLPAANTLGWAINSAAEMQLTATALSPAVDGGNSLGTTTLGWQNLFANTGFVLNIENSDWVATHTAGILTVGTGDLRVTNAGTNTASVVTVGGTQTLTNKRVTRRLTTTNAPGATPTTNTDNVDIMNFTGLNAAITSMTTNLSGTPVDGDLIEFRFTDDGTGRGITWGSSFEATTVSLPTTTVASTMLRVLFEWRGSGSKWSCIATA